MSICCELFSFWNSDIALNNSGNIIVLVMLMSLITCVWYVQLFLLFLLTLKCVSKCKGCSAPDTEVEVLVGGLVLVLGTVSLK